MLNKQFSYEGNAITFQSEDGSVMVNGTQMGRYFGKRPSNWLDNKNAKDFIAAYCESRKRDSTDLVVVTYGNNGGTWFHEDIALEFARWLSPIFAVWCNSKIKELLTQGQTSIGSNDQDAFILQAFEMLQQRVKSQSEELKKQAPKVDYYDMVLQSCSTYSANHIAKELGMSAVTLNKRLYEKKVQYKQGEVWMLYHAYQDKGYTKTKTHVFTDAEGKTKTRMMTVWTESGRKFIHEKLERQLEA